MAYICSRCGEAHGDGKSCPYLSSDKEGQRIEKIERQLKDQNERIKKFEELFNIIGRIGRFKTHDD